MLYTKADMVSKLKDNTLEVTFTKADGTERVMKCTLLETVINEVVGDIQPSSKTSTRKENPNVVSVIDTEKKVWRSFRLDSIKEVKVL